MRKWFREGARNIATDGGTREFRVETPMIVPSKMTVFIYFGVDFGYIGAFYTLKSTPK